MKLLAFDTSTEHLSIAVCREAEGGTQVWTHDGVGGAMASAAGMASVIMVTAIAVKLAHVGLDQLVFGRLQQWRQR